ncbi:putative N-acetyltransferase YuaI [Lentibacillus sp. JNUCC-1]|uniref:GNAT family N-acetyltransferase n=1 Tax=Lentibacillus sp. JNUCC-1 TaxID=2654513 RepID=UPI0012E8AA26|nr:GNAT family N-acetyltransferase [Lentibacillus sp. JNUCC-1]MUV36641.1 putative N-acetyltransferase YuaI [Lentibacillus sp. JNUCC-1]
MYTIRKARDEDAAAIADVHIRSWKNTYQELIDEQDLSNTTYENRKTLWETVLRVQKPNQCTLVIEQDGKIVGFVSGGPERTKRFKHDCEIYTIYLLDAYQKQGLGTRLLKAFATEMKAFGFSSLLVWILTQNPSSRFYERYKAEPVGKEATTIGEGTYQETAYGWDTLDELLHMLNQPV